MFQSYYRLKVREEGVLARISGLHSKKFKSGVAVNEPPTRDARLSLASVSEC